jgi:D-3-phosphoglycerate dehydrogenase
VDNIDLEAATEHGVTVLNVPSYCEEEVSTHALALLLSVARNVVHYDRHVRGGGWDWKVGAPIHRLAGKTLGLVAFGSIPQIMRRKVSGLDLEVITYDEYLSGEVFEKHDVESVSFDELLERSHYVSVHAPLTAETENLFDRDAFEAMRSSAILVNTARGPIVDEHALVEAIEKGEIAGAGLDVLPEEPPSDSPLFDLEDVVCTPHAAWYSEESQTKLRRNTARNVAEYLRGKEPINRVNSPTTD